MATYIELLAASSNPTLLQKVRVACAFAAETIRLEPDSDSRTKRIGWVRKVYDQPDYVAARMLWVLLRQYKDLTNAQILGATDAGIQTAVDAAVDSFATEG